MDNIDLQILQELSKDARQPFGKIAKKVGVSIQTIAKRYKQLKEEKIIKNCSICIDLKKIGYIGTAHLLLTFDHKKNLLKTMEQIRKNQNIIIATKTMGTHEAYVVLLFKDISDLYQRIDNIRKKFYIDKIDFSISLFTSRCFPKSRHPFEEPSNFNT